MTTCSGWCMAVLKSSKKPNPAKVVGMLLQGSVTSLVPGVRFFDYCPCLARQLLSRDLDLGNLLINVFQFDKTRSNVANNT